jgi:hypothetical protein
MEITKIIFGLAEGISTSFISGKKPCARIFSRINRGIAIEGPAASAPRKAGETLGQAIGQKAASRGRQPAHFGQATPGHFKWGGEEGRTYGWPLLFCFRSESGLGLLARVQPSLFAPASYGWVGLV